MTTERAARAGHLAVPIVSGLVAAGTTAAVTWAALNPPAFAGTSTGTPKTGAATATGAPPQRSAGGYPAAATAQDAVFIRTEKQLQRLRREIRDDMNYQLPTPPAVGSGSGVSVAAPAPAGAPAQLPPAAAPAAPAAPAPAPAPVVVQQAPPPVQVVTGASHAAP